MKPFGLGCGWGMGWVLALAIGLPASADDTDTARALEDMRTVYESRFAMLEAEVARLRGEEIVAPASGRGFAPPALSIRGFGSVQYDVAGSSRRIAGRKRSDTNHASVGPVVIFLSSQISEDISFFSEVEWDFSPSDGEGKIDVERVMLKYDYASWLQIGAGRGHTALGYWNQRFHHGTWLQTTAERPLIYAFPGDGGVLPIHFVGLEFTGNVELGEGGLLSYHANLANGRGDSIGQVQMASDRDETKMASLMATWHPIEDTGIGFSVLTDRLPGVATNALRAHRIEERIFGAHAYYEVHPWEVVAEGFAIQHDDHTINRNFGHFGGYLQLAWSMNRWKPYYRFDFLNIEGGDPFYTDAATGGPRFRAEDAVQHTGGVRWNVRDYLALKAEYRRLVGDSERENAAAVQASFAF